MLYQRIILFTPALTPTKKHRVTVSALQSITSSISAPSLQSA
jgi:hypothetical protein